MGKRWSGWALAALCGAALPGAVWMLLWAGGMAAAQGGPTPTPFYETSDDPALNARMDHVEEATSILRGLESLQPVTRALLTQEELLTYLEAELDAHYPPQAARDDAIFYHALGLMDLEVDLWAVQMAVLAEQIGGFYDPELEAMFVISEQGEMDALRQVLYAHEFTHALQDQHFDLEALVREEDVLAASDATLAALALVEGDAMLLTEGYQTWLARTNPAAALSMLGEGLFLSTEALFAAPPIIRYELTFPYTAGRHFAYTLFVAGEGWALINAAYADPPQSTEHILHPERYVAGDAPQPVRIAPLGAVLGEGWRLVWDRTLGEFYLREHLRAVIPGESAEAAAAGWGGDRCHIYFNEATEQIVLVLRIAWDRAAEAAEFAAAYRGYGALRFEEPGVATDESTICWRGEPTLCLRAGEHESLMVLAPEPALAAAALGSQPPPR